MAVRRPWAGLRSVGSGQGVLGSEAVVACRVVAAANGSGEGYSVESRRFRFDDGWLTLYIRPSKDLFYIKTLGAGPLQGVDEFA